MASSSGLPYSRCYAPNTFFSAHVEREHMQLLVRRAMPSGDPLRNLTWNVRWLTVFRSRQRHVFWPLYVAVPGLPITDRSPVSLAGRQSSVWLDSSPFGKSSCTLAWMISLTWVCLPRCHQLTVHVNKALTWWQPEILAVKSVKTYWLIHIAYGLHLEVPRFTQPSMSK